MCVVMNITIKGTDEDKIQYKECQYINSQREYQHVTQRDSHRTQQ